MSDTGLSLPIYSSESPSLPVYIWLWDWVCSYMFTCKSCPALFVILSLIVCVWLQVLACPYISECKSWPFHICLVVNLGLSVCCRVWVTACVYLYFIWFWHKKYELKNKRKYPSFILKLKCIGSYRLVWTWYLLILAIMEWRRLCYTNLPSGKNEHENFLFYLSLNTDPFLS